MSVITLYMKRDSAAELIREPCLSDAFSGTAVHGVSSYGASISQVRSRLDKRGFSTWRNLFITSVVYVSIPVNKPHFSVNMKQKVLREVLNKI